MLLAPIRKTKKRPAEIMESLRLGVEQEFDLLDGQQQLDFRALFPSAIAHGRSVPFRNCDSAALLDAGYMLACDGKEAEFATAPISFLGDGALALAREVVRCRSHMVGLMRGVGVGTVRGYSTHLSVSVPAGRERELAEAFAATIAPALILLMESRQSPGLLLRTRRGRLELGSEYIDDERQLAAAIVFLAGAVRSYLFNEQAWNQFPRLRIPKWLEADMRPGIFLPRDAYGESIHEMGRSACLQTEDGRTFTAGELFEVLADGAGRELAGLVSPKAVETLLHFARPGGGKLQIETMADPGRIAARIVHAAPPEARTLMMLARSPGSSLVPRFVDWEGAAFAWRSAGEEVVVGVPWAHLPALFSAAGKQDLRRLVPTGQTPKPVLNTLDQLDTPQAFQKIDPVALGTQALGDKAAPGGAKGGFGKPPMQLGYVAERTVLRLPPSPVRPRGIPLLLVGLVIGSLLLVVIGGGALMLLSRGGGSGATSLVARGPTATPTGVLQGIPALVQSDDTPTPVRQCLPAPVLASPANGAIRNAGVEMLWTSNVALGQGQTFAVVASTTADDLQGDSGRNNVVGTSDTTSLPLDLTQWKYAGNVGNYYWNVRIQDAAGNFVDCGGTSPRHFSVALAVGPTKPPKESSGSSGSSGGSGGGKP